VVGVHIVVSSGLANSTNHDLTRRPRPSRDHAGYVSRQPLMNTIVPTYRSVQQLLKDASFSIDEYQREYKWEPRNISELLDDLSSKFLSCYREGDETVKVSAYEDYFLGSIIVSKREGKSYLVDGQQRVTCNYSPGLCVIG
jgi:hypothetical protein